MAKPNEFASVFLDVDPEAAAGAGRRVEMPDPEMPFRILVLGDFSGQRSRSAEVLSEPHPVLIDRDNFEEVLAGPHAGVILGGEGAGRIVLSFREMEDFHPDRIDEKNTAFQRLREMRDRLNDPATYAEAAAGLAA